MTKICNGYIVTSTNNVYNGQGQLHYVECPCCQATAEYSKLLSAIGEASELILCPSCQANLKTRLAAIDPALTAETGNPVRVVARIETARFWALQLSDGQIVFEDKE